MSDSIILSSGDNNASFSSYLDTVIASDKTNDTDAAWLHFLQDHYRYLRNNSTISYVSESTMLRYAYRIRDYLNDVHGKHSDIELAFRVINHLPNDVDFTTKVTMLYIPDPQTVRQLYRAFLTQQTKINKL